MIVDRITRVAEEYIHYVLRMVDVGLWVSGLSGCINFGGLREGARPAQYTSNSGSVMGNSGEEGCRCCHLEPVVKLASRFVFPRYLYPAPRDDSAHMLGVRWFTSCFQQPDFSFQRQPRFDFNTIDRCSVFLQLFFQPS